MAFGLRPRGLVSGRGLNMSMTENVKYDLAGRQQVVGDDPSMAPPPQRFRACDGATPCTPDFAQVIKTCAKAVAHRVVGVIVEAFVLPERIDVGRQSAIAAAKASKRCHVLVADAE